MADSSSNFVENFSSFTRFENEASNEKILFHFIFPLIFLAYNHPHIKTPYTTKTRNHHSFA